jgi:hypothetical protein
VPRLLVVPERSRIDLTARPALPGARLVVDEVTGAVDLDGPADGACSGHGTLAVWLQARLDDGDRAGAVPPWLAGGEVVAVEGELHDLRGDGEGHVEVRTRFGLAGRTVGLTGAGRVGPVDAGHVQAVGVTLVDPRMLGFALPPLVTYVIRARWRLVLAPPPPA